MPPPASPALTAPSPSQARQPTVADRPSTIMPTRSRPPSGRALPRPDPRATDAGKPRPSATRMPNSGTGSPRPSSFPEAKQQEFAVTAAAMGLSLNQVLVLLALILGPRLAPSRSTIDRWVQAAAAAAGRVLGPRCALPGVGPGRLPRRDLLPRPPRAGRRRAGEHDLVPGQKAGDRTGLDLGRALAGLGRPAARHRRRRTGLQAGIARRKSNGAATAKIPWPRPWTSSTPRTRPARALAIDWNRVERAWEAEQGRGSTSARINAQGLNAGPAATRGAAAWAKAGPALRPLRGDRGGLEACRRGLGGVPSRRPAERPGLGRGPDRAGPAGAGGSGLGVGSATSLRAPESLTFLDRLHRRVGASRSPRSCARRWCGCGGCVGSGRAKSVAGAVAGAGHVAHLVQQVVCQKLDPELAGVVPAGRRGAARDGAGQQRGGVHEQRAADAPVAASDGDPGDAGPEAAVLELPRVPRREAERPLPVRAPGAEAAQLRLLGPAPGGVPVAMEEAKARAKAKAKPKAQAA